MNARQKAKKYKKEYYKLLDQYNGLLRTEFFGERINRDIVTIGTERRFSMKVLSNIPPRVVVNELYKQLIDTRTFHDAVKLDNHYEMETDTMIIQAELKVVMPDA